MLIQEEKLIEYFRLIHYKLYKNFKLSILERENYEKKTNHFYIVYSILVRLLFT